VLVDHPTSKPLTFAAERSCESLTSPYRRPPTDFMMSKPTEDVPPTTDEPPSADTLVGENSLKLNQENETTNSPNLTLSHANEEVQPEMVDGISLNADGESPQKVQSSDPAVRHESEVVQLEVFDVVPLDVDEELTQSQQSPDLTFPTESEAIPSEVSDGISLNADEESPQRPSDYEVEFFPPILPQVIATVSPPDDINPDEFSSTKTPYDVEMASGTGHHDGSVVTLDDEIAVDEFTVSTLGEVSARPHWKSGGLSVGFLNGDDQSMEDDSLLIPPPMKVNESLERKHTEANSSEADSDVHPSDDVKMKMTNRRRYISVLIAISTLMFVGALCVLGVSFIHLRRTTQDEAPTAVPEIPKDVWDFEQPRTSPPSQSTSTSVPTAGPTSSPTPIPMEQIIFSNLIAIVAGLSPTFAIDDTGSSQFRAMEWMSHDPNYFSYPYEQIVQRWTMAVLLDSLGIPILPESGRSLQSSGFWSFEHECEWFPGENVFECDESNRTIGIQFRNKGLVGTIPPEIGLLTSVGKNGRMTGVIVVVEYLGTSSE